MKLTRTRLEELVRENLGGYFGSIDPIKAPKEPLKPAGKVTKVRNPDLEEKMAEVMEVVGESEFMKELIRTISDGELNAIIEKIAREKQLTLGGIKYFENKEINEANDEYTKLGTPKEDPMGRGSRTSSLRKSVMGPKLVDKWEKTPFGSEKWIKTPLEDLSNYIRANYSEDQTLEALLEAAEDAYFESLG